MLLHGRAVRHAARRLPAALSVCGLRVEPDGPPLPPLRRGVGGAVVFELAQATAQALRERPVELLCAALRPRCPQLPAWRPWRCLRGVQGGLVWLSARCDRAAWLALVPEQGIAVLLWRKRGAGCGKLGP
ncbi:MULTISPECIES: hypothetical protein [Pseudoxanthomonas]|uniref:Uncharacterized protein n=1 Tax=Pseudoxanthomonas winnipegensis TaxID=2480810 RepID=A0AAW8GBG1_9GAMM|nr:MULTISPECIES: hypothetical protein [Pseudoxanthomonas]MDQ1118351.1 hypothetical protein [Pseudoxanthomonas winnipegensis]MDQ1131533.1 hypothetical protein [Pseudoxanthomonas winnipegensis]MDR6138450.1 hypothetical protein [Pseudoxanthomonas sp. SORGH_AS_0997]